jgi:hypothetical protein
MGALTFLHNSRGSGMKKFLILLAVMALVVTACSGGGSDSNDSGTMDTVAMDSRVDIITDVPVEPDLPVADQVIPDEAVLDVIPDTEEDIQEKPDPCLDEDCGGYGQCINSGGIAMCLCEVGFYPIGLSCVFSAPDPECVELVLPDGEVICLSSESPYDEATGPPVDTDLERRGLPAYVSHKEEYLDERCPVTTNQGPCGWCVAHAGTQALEALICRDNLEHTPSLSEPNMWWAGGKDTTNCPGGWSTVAALAVSKANYIADEETWPYLGTGGVPTEYSIDDIGEDELIKAGKYRVADYHGVKAYDIAELRAALAGGYNVNYSVPVAYCSWGTPWEIHQASPTPEDIESGAEMRCTEESKTYDLCSCYCDKDQDCPGNTKCREERCIHGYHAILITGYSDPTVDSPRGWFEFRNSWSGGWGVDGYGRLSYEFIADFGRGGAYGTEVISAADCTPFAYEQCYGGALWAFDSCDVPLKEVEKCEFGCIAGEPTCAESCACSNWSWCCDGCQFYDAGHYCGHECKLCDGAGNCDQLVEDGTACEGKWPVPHEGECGGGNCECFPDCEGKLCGDDGCGGTCGDCFCGCGDDFTCQDCPACPDVTSLACGSTVKSTTIGEASNFDMYSCSSGSKSMTGAEKVYLYHAEQEGTVMLIMQSGSWYQRLFVMDDICSPQECINSSNGAISFTAQAGRDYYVVVDNPTNFESTFEFKFECPSCFPSCAGKECGGDGCGGSCGICECGCSGDGLCLECETCTIEETVSCGDVKTGNTADFDNTFTGYTCAETSYPLRTGGEVTYSLIVENETAVYPTLHKGEDYLDVFVLEGECLPETCQISLPTDTGFVAQPGVEYFLTIDAYQGTDALYELEIACSDCIPNCSGKECGDDGCGGSCGECLCGCDDEICAACPPCEADANLTCTAAANGATAGFESSIESYGCEPAWLEGGGEYIFSFTSDQDQDVTFTLSSSWFANHDLFLLEGSCAADACVQTLSGAPVAVTAGTQYFIVVDSYDGKGGDFTLNASCAGDQPEASCAGVCGDAAPTGCWCDETCAEYGDCCKDVCLECPDLSHCCAPKCDGKECGDNGCGGSCGECDANEECNDDSQCQCAGTSIECGGVCCDVGQICVEGACCMPICDGIECGSDGCGGSCGQCSDNDVCNGEELCAEGQCLAGEALDCADDNLCTDDSCDPVAGCLNVNNTIPCTDTNECTKQDVCTDGACLGIEVVCNDDNLCTDDSCDPATGCTFTNNAVVCDDDDVCNGSEICGDGLCNPGDALDCEDDNPCTHDWCDPVDGCQHANNTVPCDDGDACTVSDVCKDGVCEGTEMGCDDGNPCTDDVCDTATGCAYNFNQAGCDDQNACTENDLCKDGVCTSGTPLGCGDNNDCTSDSCDPAAGCVYETTGQPCDDENICTFKDMCNQDGVCTGQSAVTCDDGNPCTDDSCDPVDGCQHVSNVNPCDDYNECTVEDACVDGVCKGTGSLECDDGNPCTKDICLLEGGCDHVNIDVACTDNNPCTLNDMCVEGQCQSGDELDCNDDNPCTVDSCNDNGECVYQAVDGACDDDNACTTGDHCDTGLCVFDDVVVCDDEDNVCTTDSCDPKVGCLHEPNTLWCNDGDICTLGDTCTDGACISDGVMDCDDDNICTSDSCDPAGGCDHTAKSVPCDDGNACTTGDECAEGSCLGVSEIDCDDGNACTTDFCYPDVGCVNEFNQNPCDDGDACTQFDHCEAGECAGGAPVDCDDDNVCTTDSCTPADGCLYQPNTLPCSDGDVCTTKDTCADGACASQGLLECEDTNPCTDASCDPAVGCVQTFNATQCDDNNTCTSNDMCVEGVCLGEGEGEENCDDNNPCTKDLCLPEGECGHENLEIVCDDGNLCTMNDMCVEGVCQAGEVKDCDDANPCTADSCDETGQCVHQATDGACDDGSACTDGDYCEDGLCVYAELVNCDNGNPCTTDYCNPTEGCIHDDNAAPCDDLDLCTTGDVCEAGVCAGPGELDCDDSNPCTNDYCLPKLGCVHDNNLQPCDDGNECTENDMCKDGGCKAGLAIDCNDGNICTYDSCDPVTGCVYQNNTVPCNDGNACTFGDVCSDGACSYEGSLTCDDNNVCTDDSCNPESGCVFAPNAGDCDDGNACTDGDHCQGGKCVFLEPTDCSDGLICTNDACNPLTGCYYNPIDQVCNDGNDCTTDSCDVETGCTYASVPDETLCGPEPSCDVLVWHQANACVSGVCITGGISDCDDGNQCTDDVCDPALGCASPITNGASCDDGDECTGPDICGEDVCGGADICTGAPVVNEVDYDQVGTDSLEFVELYNPGDEPAKLDDFKVEFVNGNNDEVYNFFELGVAGKLLYPGQYLVIGGDAVNKMTPEGTLTILLTGSIQNGAPDGIRVVRTADNSFVDGVHYEGTMEGTGEGQEGPTDQEEGAIGRCPNGSDTHNNAIDFTWTCMVTPGADNSCVSCSDNAACVENNCTCDELYMGDGYDCLLDSDGDGVPDVDDNCPWVANPDQVDDNQDGKGDVCEGDFDGDGVLDPVDNCPENPNADQADSDDAVLWQKATTGDYRVFMDPDGNLYSLTTIQIRKWDPLTGDQLAWFGRDQDGNVGWHDPNDGSVPTAGSEPGAFSGLQDFDRAPDGKWHAFEGLAEARVQVFDENWNYESEWVATGANKGRGIAVDLDGNTYISATFGNKVIKFNPAYENIGEWPGMGYPGDIDYSPVSNKLYVADAHKHVFRVFATDGTELKTISTSLYPNDIEIVANGNVYLMGRFNTKIFDLDGNYTGQVSGTYNFTGVAANVGGTVFYCHINSGINAVGPDGIGDVCDNCPSSPNGNQVDTDEDGIGDICDECPEDEGNDPDNDDVCSKVDNCPLVYNPNQENDDEDGTGDACDCQPANPEIPSCDGKVCGDDGCDGSCGGCLDQEQCVEGQCV